MTNLRSIIKEILREGEYTTQEIQKKISYKVDEEILEETLIRLINEEQIVYLGKSKWSLVA